jgi:circadian clock protein KaiB
MTTADSMTKQSMKWIEALAEDATEKYSLRLYVTGTTLKSVRAIANVKNICETHLKGRYNLEVVDIYQQPSLAKSEQLIAAPTLIKSLPLPLRKFIGDMTRSDRIMIGLDLRSSKKPAQADGNNKRSKERE